MSYLWHAARHVLWTLLNNACRFTHRGFHDNLLRGHHAALEVTLLVQEPEASTFRFAVRDTGRGVPRARQPLLFTRRRAVPRGQNPAAGARTGSSPSTFRGSTFTHCDGEWGCTDPHRDPRLPQIRARRLCS